VLGNAHKRARVPWGRQMPFNVCWNRWILAPLALACAAIAVPWLLTHSPETGFALQRAFALVCHQHTDRSFSLFGGTVAVCARCLGIYLGAAAGLMVRATRPVAWRWLLVAAALNLADWLAEFGGIHDNWMFARFALGIALGVAAAVLLVASEKTPTQARKLGWGTRLNEATGPLAVRVVIKDRGQTEA